VQYIFGTMVERCGAFDLWEERSYVMPQEGQLANLLRALTESTAALNRMERKIDDIVSRYEDCLLKSEMPSGSLTPTEDWMGVRARGDVEEPLPLFDLDVDRKKTDEEIKKEVSFRQAAKFLRFRTHLEPIKAKKTERKLLEWLQDLTDEMDMTMLDDLDRKTILQALLQERTCQRLWKTACAAHEGFKAAIEAWLTALYPNSWVLMELFQGPHMKTYRGIDNVVAECIKGQRLWLGAAARKNMKKEDNNMGNSSFEAFCSEVTQKLKLPEVENDCITPVDSEDRATIGGREADVYALKIELVMPDGNPLLELGEVQQLAKQVPTTRSNPSVKPQRNPLTRSNPHRFQGNIHGQEEKWTRQDVVWTRRNQQGDLDNEYWVFDPGIEYY
jgi:hypothetical protein